MNSLVDAALYYVSIGWKVFPCVPGDKAPAVPSGFKAASRDEKTIRSWWERNPLCNIGLATGDASGISVVDLDSKNGVSGLDTVRHLTNGFGIPDTLTQATPTGGSHWLYTAQEHPACRVNLYPSVDIRGNGGYVLLAPSVHPNGGTYQWFPGRSPWEWAQGAAEFPGFLIPEKRAIVVPASTAVITQPAIHDDNTIARASAYLATCDPAIQGCNGHSSLLWADVALVHGYMLSDQQAFNLLSNEYNPRCSPPWDLGDSNERRDFQRKVSEARKLVPDHPRGWLLNDQEYAPVDTSNVDVGALLEKKAKSKLADIVDPSDDYEVSDDEFDFLTQPPGFLGELCSWINATSLRPQPMLTLGCSLAFCGVLYGRKVRDFSDLRTNIYCMGIGRSSAGKMHAVKRLRRLLLDTGCLDLLGGDDWASDTSIETQLSRFPATIWLLDEIGHIFLNIQSGKSPHLNKIISTLMKLYSSAGDVYKGKDYADGDKRRIIIQPCACLWGTATPENWAEGVTPQQLSDGWLSRCLVFHTQTKPPKTRGLIWQPPPQSISDHVLNWFTREIPPQDGAELGKIAVACGDIGFKPPPNQIVIETMPVAEQMFRDLEDEARLAGEHMRTIESLWDRAEENARKVALIVGSGCDFERPVIDEQAADYACRLVRHLLKDFRANTEEKIVSPGTAKKKQQLLDVIKSHGINGCPKRELTKRTEWSNMRERHMLLSDLQESEQVFSGSKDGDERQVYYWSAKGYAAYRKHEDES
jgi:hypothetical protein